MRERTCCFTGHRELPITGQKELAIRLEETIIGLIERGVQFYGARGARGFDALAAQTVLNLKNRYPNIRLILVLPCLILFLERKSITRSTTQWNRGLR